MFGLGAPELIVILIIILVIFGAGKLPQIGGALGRGIREFRDATDGKADETTKLDSTNKPSEQKKSGL
jgi:sec-independent protein translocase protein TatA